MSEFKLPTSVLDEKMFIVPQGKKLVGTVQLLAMLAYSNADGSDLHISKVIPVTSYTPRFILSGVIIPHCALCLKKTLQLSLELPDLDPVVNGSELAANAKAMNEREAIQKFMWASRNTPEYLVIPHTTVQIGTRLQFIVIVNSTARRGLLNLPALE